MTKVIRLALVAAAVSAASGTVTAEARSERADLACALTWHELQNRILAHRLRSPGDTYNPHDAYDVYDGRPCLGSELDTQIRSEILRDRELPQ